MSQSLNRVVLSPDSSAERQFLPEVDELTNTLLLADRGYFARAYLEKLDSAGGYFIVRAGNSINPLIVNAVAPDGKTVKALANRRLKAVVSKLSRYEFLDLFVQFQGLNGPWQ